VSPRLWHGVLGRSSLAHWTPVFSITRKYARLSRHGLRSLHSHRLRLRITARDHSRLTTTRHHTRLTTLGSYLALQQRRLLQLRLRTQVPQHLSTTAALALGHPWTVARILSLGLTGSLPCHSHERNPTLSSLMLQQRHTRLLRRNITTMSGRPTLCTATVGIAIETT
jgi:hypothetical protein